MTQKSGLFLGLTTMDIIYLVDNPPKVDEKINASDQLIVAGGPATNAAITFSALKGHSMLASVVGRHFFGDEIRQELAQYHVDHMDLSPNYADSPAISSIMVKKDSGQRSVVSVNAANQQVADFPFSDSINRADILLVDGHQIRAAVQACFLALQAGIPTVLDAGSWKEQTDQLLPFIDYAVCSERFLPPDCTDPNDVVEYNLKHGIKYTAITRGEKPILYAISGEIKSMDILHDHAIVDTLGAGDIFHGAFCYYLLEHGNDFKQALVSASQVASFSCRYFGTREWIKNFGNKV